MRLVARDLTGVGLGALLRLRRETDKARACLRDCPNRRTSGPVQISNLNLSSPADSDLDDGPRCLPVFTRDKQSFLAIDQIKWAPRKL